MSLLTQNMNIHLQQKTLEYSCAAEDEGTNFHPLNHTMPCCGFKAMLQSHPNLPPCRGIALTALSITVSVPGLEKEGRQSLFIGFSAHFK